MSHPSVFAVHESRTDSWAWDQERGKVVVAGETLYCLSVQIPIEASEC